MASLLSQRQELESHLEQAVRSQSPIYRLPEELLSSIFVTGVCQSDDQDSLLVSSLMLVCRYWRDVVVNSPELWATVCISPHDSLEKARRRLARSKAVPLDITVNFTPRSDSTTGVMENIIRAMDLLRPALWRARSFRLSVPNRPQAHAALLRCKEDAPLLETLSICIFHSMQEDHYSSPCLPLFNGHTPRLRSCSFTSFNFGWDRRLVSGLRVLQLGGYWNGFSPSVDKLLEMLRACPQLEELALRNMSDADPDASVHSEPEFMSNKVVKLPRLIKASFYYAGNMRVRMLLSQMSLPALESLEFCYLDNLTPILEYLRQQSLTSLPLRHLRIESSFFNEPKFVTLLKRLMSLMTLELIDIEDVSSFLLKVNSCLVILDSHQLSKRCRIYPHRPLHTLGSAPKWSACASTDARAWNGTPCAAWLNPAFLASLCSHLPPPRQRCALCQARQPLRISIPLPWDVAVHSLLLVG